MQSPIKKTSETSPTGLPQAPEDHRNPSYQHYTPQFGVGGGIHGIFQYAAPEAKRQTKPPTPMTPIEQRALQERVLQTIQAAEQTQQVLQKRSFDADKEHTAMLSFLPLIITTLQATFATLAELIWTQGNQEQYAQDIKAIRTDIGALQRAATGAASGLTGPLSYAHVAATIPTYLPTMP